MWNWSQQHDFYLCWAKSCMGLPWVIPVIHWFCLKQLILSILSTFQLLKIWKINFAANHWEYVWNWSQQHDFHHCWAKNCMGIPWGIPEIHWFCLKQLILSILSTFQLLKILKKLNLLQTTVNMCETSHINMTYTTVKPKIAWDYRDAYLRYSNFA